MKRFLPALGAALLCAAPARAADINTDDARCLIVGIVLSSNTAPDVQKLGDSLTIYFLGRLDGVTPGASLLEPLTAQMQAMDKTAFQQAIQSCTQTLAGRAKLLNDMGEQLQGKPATPPVP